MHQTYFHRGLSCGAFEEMAESELIAEPKGCGNLCQCLAVTREQCIGTFDPLSLDISGKRFAHDAIKQIRAIFFGVTKKIRQHFERDSTMKILADEGRDACRQRFWPGRSLLFRGYGMRQVKEIAYEFA
jgi:hypothetical protein